MSEFIRGVFGGVKKEILNFADVALKSGAAKVGKELVNVTRDVNQPSDLNLGAITNALKVGIMATGQELMTRGLERMKANLPQDQNSTVSEESLQSEEEN